MVESLSDNIKKNMKAKKEESFKNNDGGSKLSLINDHMGFQSSNVGQNAFELMGGAKSEGTVIEPESSADGKTVKSMENIAKLNEQRKANAKNATTEKFAGMSSVGGSDSLGLPAQTSLGFSLIGGRKKTRRRRKMKKSKSKKKKRKTKKLKKKRKTKKLKKKRKTKRKTKAKRNRKKR